MFYHDIPYLIYKCRYGVAIKQSLDQLNRSEWYTRSELEAYQYEKLSRLMKHVYAHVPYYRRIMREMALKPAHIKKLTDIKYLPILNKSIIRKEGTNMFSAVRDDRRGREGRTGGTTGEPLRFVHDVKTIIAAEAALLRGKSWAGYRLGVPTASLMTVGKPTFLGKARERLISIHAYSAFSTEDDVIKGLEKIRRRKICFLESYASNLYRIARICHDRKIEDISLPVIFSTGEVLLPYQKELIEKQFGSQVFDYYGSNEIGSLAYECKEHHNKHITDEHVILEVTDSRGNPLVDEMGEITITDLDNYAMPFVRYKIGDIGIITEEVCGCGRKLNILKHLEGRMADFLKGIDGSLISPVAFLALLRNIIGLSEYQIVQIDRERVQLIFVKNELFSENELELIAKTIKEVMGDAVYVDFEERASIRATDRGKHRLIVSRLTT
ncbi:MAG: phenylacetate--CoA ligase family protein [Thermodesulfobacteriota bacterium]